MVKNLPTNAKDAGSIPGSGRSPGVGNDNPIPVFLPGESHGLRTLEGYSPWGCEELDMTKQTEHACMPYVKGNFKLFMSIT